MSYVIVAEFTVAPEAADAFERHVCVNARASVETEPGCQRFNVARAEEPGRFLLYEIYTDEAAFAEHLASAHFKAFDTATAPTVRDKTVRAFALAESPTK